MSSWVYLFSKFTPEALLFEALMIFILLCSYMAFWILRKRRFGSVENTIPSGPVKEYLNELINNAEQIRLQLFGLLNSNEMQHKGYQIVGMNQTSAPDPTLTIRLADLENKLTNQTKALEVLADEKSRLEKELAESRASSLANVTSAKTKGEGTKELQNKIHELEAKLTEYSVIEDDLANLKRLQQENEQLKSLMNARHMYASQANSTAPTTAASASKTGNQEEASAFEYPPEPAELSQSPAPEPGSGSPDPATQPSGNDPASKATPTDKDEAELFAEFEKILKE
jgi:hypothetical protein